MRLAFEAIHPERLAQPIPVGVRLPKDGEYTIALDTRYDLTAFEHIYLIDNRENKHIDLIDEEAYSFSGTKSQIDDRFSIVLVLRPKTTTSIDNKVSGIFVSGRSGSLMLTGISNKADIYIYDMSGRLVEHNHVNNQSTAVYAVPTGVYQVRVVTDTNNALLRTIVY